MTYEYEITTNNEKIRIGSVHKTERNDDEYTFIDNEGDIIAMLKKEFVRGILRVPAVMEKKGTEEAIRREGERPFLDDPREKQLKPPINNDAPPGSIIPDYGKLSSRRYQLIKNQDTKGYEVHSNLQKAKNENVDGQEDQLMEFCYQDVTALGLYNPRTKKIVVEKGTLIRISETHSLQVSENREGARRKRARVMERWTEPYDQEYKRLIKDIEFNSLSQAGCVISGSVVSPKYTWKVVG